MEHDNRGWTSIGQEINTTVNDAIKRGDFANLNSLINDTVSRAIAEAKNQTQSAMHNMPYTVNTQITRNNKSVTIHGGDRVQGYMPANVTTYSSRNSTAVRKVGKTAGVLFNVFGGIGLGITTASIFVGGLISKLFFGSGLKPTFLIGAVLWLVFFGMIQHGCKLLKRVNRAERYAESCGSNRFVTIDELVSKTGMKKSKILKDLHSMLGDGFFPQGHFDKKETCFILSDELYQTYLQLERSQTEKLLEKKKQDEQNDTEMKLTTEEQNELDQMVKEGNEYIMRLRNLNDRIAGEVISEKLYRMENLLKEIFIQVKKYPEKMGDMHRLMEYYLPTTFKLVEAYAEFDQVSEPGQDIVSAKQEIENTIDTINVAYHELLNKLFQDRVFDVSTDAQVLQTLLSKEGLIQNDFQREEEKVPIQLQ